MEENRQDLNNLTPSNSPPPASIDPNQKKMEGIGDAMKESFKEDRKAKETLDNLVDVSNRVLLRTKTKFPDIFFPTEILIDLTKINIIRHVGFGSKSIHSVFVADVTDVLVHSNFWAATLQIVDSGFSENSIFVKNLPVKDAYEARSLIQGIVIAKKQNIDLSKLENTNDFVDKLKRLGSAKVA